MLANVTLPHTFSNGTTADAQQVDDNFTAITTQVNGNLDDTNVKPGALTGASLASEAVKPSNSEGLAYALHVFGGSFVFSGARASKDGTVSNKLDVTAGVIFVKQADGSLRVLQPASNSFTTSVASTTYYLDFNPDGSWWWNTAHSTTSGYLSVATATTDGSGNISAVTQTTASDSPTLFGGMVGTPLLANNPYLRTDSGAPNPQTVSNGVTFNGQVIMPNGPWYMTNALGTGKSTQFGTTTNVQGVTSDLFAIAEEGTQWVFGLDHNGNLGITGNVYTYSGELGSASGTWTPSSGSLNVSAGTVINIASVPSAAKLYNVVLKGSTSATTAGSGVMTSSGSAWLYDNGTSHGGSYSGGISSTSVYGTGGFGITDGSYLANGYFQINNGYFQFVVTSSSSNSNPAEPVYWGVS